MARTSNSKVTELVKISQILDLIIIETATFADERGFFNETARLDELNARLKEPFIPVQVNHSRSKKGVLRGIHIAPWAKLIYLTSGETQAIFVDLRENSPTFGKHLSLILNENKRARVYIPPGFGNAFLALSDVVDYVYIVDQPFRPGIEVGVAWNDPLLKISWKIKNPILSPKDQNNKTVKELFPNKLR